MGGAIRKVVNYKNVVLILIYIFVVATFLLLRPLLRYAPLKIAVSIRPSLPSPPTIFALKAPQTILTPHAHQTIMAPKVHQTILAPQAHQTILAPQTRQTVMDKHSTVADMSRHFCAAGIFKGAFIKNGRSYQKVVNYKNEAHNVIYTLTIS